MSIWDKIWPKTGKFGATQQAQPKAYYYNRPTPFSGGNGGEKWDNGLSRNGQEFNIDQYKMMLNARRAYHDSPAGRGIVKALANGVIGTGLRYESAIKFEELGISQEDAEKIGAELERKFDLWANSKKGSRDGSMNFYQAQKLYMKSQVRDGEVFSRFYYSNRQDLISNLQFSFIDPTQIQGYGFFSTAGNYAYDDGIIRNKQGEEIGYKITVQDESSPFKTKNVEVPAQSGGRKLMIHGYMAEYAGQKRGYSHIGHMLQELQLLKDYELATAAKAAAQSKINGFVEPSENAPASGIFDNVMGNVPAGPGTPITTEIPAGEVREDGTTVCNIPEVAAADPGSWFMTNLQAGEKIKFAPNTAPADNLKEFIDANMAYLAPSADVPLEVLKMLWGSSFSASRATLLQFQEIKEFWRDEIAADFLNPILEAWLSEEVAAGNISLPGFSDPKLRAAWLGSKWSGSGVPNIDPLKTANAVKTNWEMNLTNGDREAMELNGSSFAANIMKNQRQFPEMPIPPWADNQNLEDKEEDDG
jgi:lambda family phage portal protein